MSASGSTSVGGASTGPSPLRSSSSTRADGTGAVSPSSESDRRIRETWTAVAIAKSTSAGRYPTRSKRSFMLVRTPASGPAGSPWPAATASPRHTRPKTTIAPTIVSAGSSVVGAPPACESTGSWFGASRLASVSKTPSATPALLRGGSTSKRPPPARSTSSRCESGTYRRRSIAPTLIRHASAPKSAASTVPARRAASSSPRAESVRAPLRIRSVSVSRTTRDPPSSSHHQKTGSD